MGRNFVVLAILCVALGVKASASATLLLEEPYGRLGFFTATGHAAVYLSGICAQTPLILRRCAAGELGVVLSRYDGVAGYDWIAIPLVPYLYAVDRPDDVPLFADAKIVRWLRDRYRRNHLQDIAPDLPNRETPGRNWFELVGASYDRTIYGFQVETSTELSFFHNVSAYRQALLNALEGNAMDRAASILLRISSRISLAMF